jgi:hypothetical protein
VDVAREHQDALGLGREFTQGIGVGALGGAGGACGSQRCSRGIVRTLRAPTRHRLNQSDAKLIGFRHCCCLQIAGRDGFRRAPRSFDGLLLTLRKVRFHCSAVNSIPFIAIANSHVSSVDGPIVLYQGRPGTDSDIPRLEALGNALAAHAKAC